MSLSGRRGAPPGAAGAAGTRRWKAQAGGRAGAITGREPGCSLRAERITIMRPPL